MVEETKREILDPRIAKVKSWSRKGGAGGSKTSRVKRDLDENISFALLSLVTFPIRFS